MHSLDSLIEHLLCAGHLGWDGDRNLRQRVEEKRPGAVVPSVLGVGRIFWVGHSFRCHRAPQAEKLLV